MYSVVKCDDFLISRFLDFLDVILSANQYYWLCVPAYFLLIVESEAGWEEEGGLTLLLGM